MTDTTHTPGPWKIVTATVGVNETIFHDPPQVVCERGSFIADTDRRNARLIAAAPDLLEALEIIVDVLEHPLPPHHVGYVAKSALIRRARAAIAKATGQ